MDDKSDFGPILPRHFVFLLTLATLWGSSFMVIKIGVQDLSALDLTAWRLIIAAVFMGMIALLLRSKLPDTPKAIGYCFALAVFGNSLPFFLISWGEERIDSGLAAILMAVMPLTTLVLAHFLVRGDRLDRRKLIGVAFGFGGIVVLVGPTALQGLGDQVVRQIATAGGAVCYAISVIIVRNMPPTPMIGRGALVLFFSALQSAGVALILGGGQLDWPGLTDMWPAAYLGVFPTALATLVLFKLMSEREPSFVAFQNYLVPIFGVLWGALLLNEAVTIQALVALGLILLGIFIANSRQLLKK